MRSLIYCTGLVIAEAIGKKDIIADWWFMWIPIFITFFVLDVVDLGRSNDTKNNSGDRDKS